MKRLLLLSALLLTVSCAALKPQVTVTDGRTNTAWVVKDGVLQALETAKTVTDTLPFPYGPAAGVIVSGISAVLAGMAARRSHKNATLLTSKSSKSS